MGVGAYQSICDGEGDGTPDEPAWSPDGRWIAVERFGNSSVTGLTWLPDGKGLAMTARLAADATPQVWEISEPGGRATELTHDLQGYHDVSVAAQTGALSLVHSNPQFSVWEQAKAGGAFTEVPGGGADQDGTSGVAWTPQGRIVSIRSPGGKAQLWLEGGGAPARMLAVNFGPGKIVRVWVAPDGEIIFAVAEAGQWNLWRVNGDGGEATDLTPGIFAFGAAVVGGGKDIAFERYQTIGKTFYQRIWIMPLAGGAARLLWPGAVYDNFVLAMPGGKRVLVYAIVPSTPRSDLAEEIALDGSKPLVVRPNLRNFMGPIDLTPDGRALTGILSQGSVDNIWAAPLDGGKRYRITHFTDLSIAHYAFAPDGRLAVSRGSKNSDAVLATGLVKKP